MNGFMIENGLLRSYWGPGGDVTVPEGVTRLELAVFRNCSKLISIRLPEGLETIDDRVFEGCANLTEVTLPQSLASLGRSVFDGCRSLKSIIFPAGITAIEDETFRHCENLAEVTLPKNLKSIGNSAFCGCRSLQSIVFPEGLEMVDIFAFRSCEQLTEVVLPQHLAVLGQYAFAGCSKLKNVVLPEGLECIKPGVFCECRSLQDVRFPKKLISIGEKAFRDCESLRGPMLPDSIQSIGEEAFAACKNLSTTLPGGLTELGKRAFCECRNLHGPLPSGLTKLGCGALRGCAGLADKDGFVIHGNTLFCYAGSSRETVIPESITYIDECAFQGAVRVHIPESVTGLDADAFYESDLIVYVRHWIPALTKALKHHVHVIAIVTEDEDQLSGRLKRAAKIGIAFWKDRDLSSEKAKKTMAWLSDNSASRDVMEAAFTMPEFMHFLCDHRLIKPKDLDAYLKEMQEWYVPEQKRRLLKYRDKISDAVEQVRKNREQQAEAAETERNKRSAARKTEDGIKGLRFVIQGPRLWRIRLETIKSHLERNGAFLDHTVTGKTDYLVRGNFSDDPLYSAKYRRAEELRVPIIWESDFYKMIGLDYKSYDQNGGDD